MRAVGEGEGLRVWVSVRAVAEGEGLRVWRGRLGYQ